MLCGLRQAIEIGREAFCLGAWRHTVGAHEQHRNTRCYARTPIFSRQYLLYNTVVLGNGHSSPGVMLTAAFFGAFVGFALASMFANRVKRKALQQ
jgi:hypothetical protein